MQSEMQSGLIRRSKGNGTMAWALMKEAIKWTRYHSVGGSATHAPSSLVTDAPDAALGAAVVDETVVVDETAVVDETVVALRTEAPSRAFCVMERKRRRGTLRLLSTTPIAVHGQAGESLRARAPDEGGHRHAIGEATGRWQSGYNQFTIRLQSDVNQTSIRWQSDGNQMAISWQSDGNQITIIWKSDGNQVTIRWQSGYRGRASSHAPPHALTRGTTCRS